MSTALATAAIRRSFIHHTLSSFGHSEPNPAWFGNPANAQPGVNWLKSIFHVSFAEHSDERKQQFGVLRVMNDDLVQPQRGFGTHPHENMEIVTYIIDGKLSHKDDGGGRGAVGNEETLGRGAVQFMSAGRGVRHSEHNRDPSAPLRFIQTWILPRTRGIAPRYGSRQYLPEQFANQWLQLAGDEQAPGASAPDDTVVRLNQDVNFYATILQPGQDITYGVGCDRQAYILTAEGSAQVLFGLDAATTPAGEQHVEAHEALSVVGQHHLRFTAGSDGAHFLLVEMAASNRNSPGYV